MRTHENLDVWKKAVDLVVDVYRVTEKFPPDERFGLTSQIRRAEVSTQVLIAMRLGFISDELNNDLRSKLDEIGRMLTGLRNHIRSKQQ